MKHFFIAVGLVFLLAGCSTPEANQQLPSPTLAPESPSPTLLLPETDSLPVLPEAPELPPTFDGQNDADITYCTQEVTECPDGSYVGREGPDCEFAACPDESDFGGSDAGEDDANIAVTPSAEAPQESFVACPMDAKQCPDGSFVERTAPNCEFAACPTE